MSANSKINTTHGGHDADPTPPSAGASEVTQCRGCRCNLMSGDWCRDCWPKPNLNDPGLLTVGAAAKALKVPEGRIYGFLRDGAPCLRVGRAVRVRLEDLRPRIEADEERRRNFQWYLENCPE